MKILTDINNIPKSHWDALLNSSNVASIFQTADCYAFYESLSFMQPFVFALVDEADCLRGVVVGYIQRDGGAVKRFFSRRAIINGGPMLANDISQEELKALLDAVRKDLSGKAIYIESRNFNDYSKYKGVFEECGFKYEEHLNFHIDTTSEDVVNANMGKSRKRDVKTSLRDGAVVVENPTLDEVREFHTVLDNLYKTKVKTPSYPLEFFEKLFQQHFSRFILVKYDGRIIGGTVCVCLEGKAVYEWFACGADGVYKNIYPSTVATHAGIMYAAQRGYKRFDMMGAGKPSEGYGVRDFKAKFGGQLVEHGRFRIVLNTPLYGIGKLGIKLMKKDVKL